MDPNELEALHRDAQDPLAAFRDEFCIPSDKQGKEWTYFTGNSLGLQPRATQKQVNEELQFWAELAVEGHFRGKAPWMDYHSLVRDYLAELVGALPSEVVAMNSLSVNLHLMMVSFYRPTPVRHAVLIEKHAFPSDRYAVESHLRLHGYDPASALIELEADEPGGTLSNESIARAIEQNAERVALILLPGVQYLTGQLFDIRTITTLAHQRHCIIGFDLAHAIGNVPIALHDDGPDFAVWCSYKYLNSGPGAVAGCFVHERHERTSRPRFAGWWGHDASTRFQMGPDFVPTLGAEGWQLSNPPILALAPLRCALDQFHRAGIDRLRHKSIQLTGSLADLIQCDLSSVIDIVTPLEAQRRGCQLSLKVKGTRDQGRSLFEYLQHNQVIVDWREPNVLRMAPTPLYNRYIDNLRFVQVVKNWMRR
jgi:kynureninase